MNLTKTDKVVLEAAVTTGMMPLVPEGKSHNLIAANHRRSKEKLIAAGYLNDSKDGIASASSKGEEAWADFPSESENQ